MITYALTAGLKCFQATMVSRIIRISKRIKEEDRFLRREQRSEEALVERLLERIGDRQGRVTLSGFESQVRSHTC